MANAGDIDAGDIDATNIYAANAYELRDFPLRSCPKKLKDLLYVHPSSYIVAGFQGFLIFFCILTYT